jgi:competence protein ComEC
LSLPLALAIVISILSYAGMASKATHLGDSPGDPAPDAALQHGSWRRQSRLSRGLAGLERFLGTAAFDRAPWLVVAFAAGIGLWFGLPTQWHWLGLIAGCLALSVGAIALFRDAEKHSYVKVAAIAVPAMMAAGCMAVWVKSELVGATPIERPEVTWMSARVLDREERPAEDRARLIVVTRPDGEDRQLRVRLNLPSAMDDRDIRAGALLRVRARLMPPAPPMLPGAYNFARTAWFSGLSATGTVIAPVEIVEPGQGGDFFADLQGTLARHVREQLAGSTGGIAATLAAGDRGGIGEDDAQAMRDAGLAHLLSISGLHVSAVIGATYLLAIRLLALWPWLALRVRLPVLAAGAGALAGIGYTLLTGSEVPTVRSCIGAVLVLLALAMGREALSMRVLAVAALVVLLFWPESLVGPSFQMSFAAVMTIIALSRSAPIRRFLGPREEGMLARGSRYLAMLFLTSLAIELVLMPIALFHFHRGGVYGSVANLVAIPLTTVVTMPLIAVALVLDMAGLGAPAWWLAGKAIDVMLAVAHWVSSQPGAVSTLPAMGTGSYLLFVAGGLWFALWSGPVRWLGVLPATLGALSLAMLTPPDILVSGDGRHVGITGEIEDELLVLRDSRSSFARDNLTELAGMDGETRLLDDWPGALCSTDFCSILLERGGRSWRVLMARSHMRVPERALASACARADIVIADRWLPRSCRPKWFKADRSMLRRTGGLAIRLDSGEVRTVAQGQGRHGWWSDPFVRARPKAKDRQTHEAAGRPGGG